MELLHRYAGNAKLWPPTKNNRFWLTRGAWWLHMEPMAAWFGEFDGEVRDINTYVRAFRFTQAEALRYVVSAIRYAGDRKAGIIIWMGNEPFPNAANTSVLEFDGCPKPAYYELKRMYAPVMLGLRHDSIVAKDGTVTVTPFWRADAAARMQDAMVEVYDMQGKRLLSKSLTAADSPCDWDAIAVSVASPVLVRIFSQEREVCVEYIFLPEGEHPFAPLLSLPKASVTAECLVDGVLLTNTGDAVALYCDLTVYGEDGSPLCAQDGNLCLLPGEQRFVRVEGGKRCALQPLNV